MAIKFHRNHLFYIFVALFLSACGAGEAESVVDETTVNDIYTQVALTITAQAPVATNTPLPTFTSFPTTSGLFLSTSTPASAIPVSLNTGGSNAVGCDNSVYLSDVTIPDGTVLTPGESFTKTWSMQNTGSCEWTTSYSIVFYSGNSMSGSTTSLSSAVSPGGSLDVSVALTAPTTENSYTSYWRLQNASGTPFGEAVYVQIVVSGSTSTATYTATPEDEETSTPTPTTEPTSTPIPTDTPIPTETPSS